jgi:DNA-binding NarL/FixJ family response regulator
MALKFLVVDDHADGRSLINRTLLRKFPTAAIVECVDATTAMDLVSTDHFDAAIVHRAGEVPGVELVQFLRHLNRDLVILMISGRDQTEAAFAAGATRFMNYDEWLMIGTVMTELLTKPERADSTVAVG